MYKFRSKAAGDVIMLRSDGDQLLRVLGRSPSPQGIFEAEQLPQLMALLRAAAGPDARADGPAQSIDDATKDATQDAAETAVGAAQRLWPMLRLMERAYAARQPITWGA